MCCHVTPAKMHKWLEPCSQTNACWGPHGHSAVARAWRHEEGAGDSAVFSCASAHQHGTLSALLGSLGTGRCLSLVRAALEAGAGAFPLLGGSGGA